MTPDEFLARFPEFSGVPASKVSGVVAEANVEVGDNWPAAIRTTAAGYFAAHLLAVTGEPAKSAASAAGQTYNGPMKSRKVGDVEVTYQNRNESLGTGNGGLDASGFAGTEYGRLYLRLLKRYFGGAYAL